MNDAWRAAEADRSACIDRLQHAYAEGRLDEAALRARIDAALHAQTVGELEALVRDLPPALPPSPSGGSAARPRGDRHGERGHVERDGLRRTDERFRDPTTNRIMRVWLTPSGERRYLPDA